jgi:hypothetical protein
MVQREDIIYKKDKRFSDIKIFTISELKEEVKECMTVSDLMCNQGSVDAWKAIAVGCLILTAMMIGRYVLH